MNISVEKKKAEAINRMKKLGLFEEVIQQFDKLDRVSICAPPSGAFYWIDGEDLEHVREFEQEYDALVYLVIRNFTRAGVVDSFLFVSDYIEDWEDDHRIMKDGEAIVYAYNHAMPDCSEIGYAGVSPTATGLCRTW